MNCAEFETLLCDYLDGTLDAARRTELENHQRECAACAEFVKDVTGAVSFLERVPEVEPPTELLAKIAFEIPQKSSLNKGAKSWLMSWIQPVIQPRFAMGMAMTLLSFSMLGRFAGIEVRQLKASDLEPAKVWAAIDDRAHRTWARAVKYYDNLRLVYEVQSKLQEWADQEDEKKPTPEGKEKK